jgi:hypothetical protein
VLIVACCVLLAAILWERSHVTPMGRRMLPLIVETVRSVLPSPRVKFMFHGDGC